MPATSSLFKSNRSQAVRLPKDVAFAEDVKKVVVTRVGKSVVITPVEALWDDFFAQPGDPTFPERGPQPPSQERESF